jgi:hypothetical protein
MAEVLLVDVVYVVLDIVLISLGLMVVMRWGKVGVMGKFLSWLVLGFIAYAVGDTLWIVAVDLELIEPLGAGTVYEFTVADMGYLLALVFFLIAISYPVRHIMKAPKEPPKEEDAESGSRPQQGTSPSGDAPAPAQAPPVQ